MITGAIFRFSMGPKGMFSGAFFGAFLGSVAGAMVVSISKLTGATMQDAYNSAQTIFVKKDLYFHGAFRVSHI